MKKNNFKIGDKVLVVDEDVRGVIAFAKADFLTIHTTDGLTLEYMAHELVLDLKMDVQTVVVKQEPAAVKGKTRAVTRKKAAQIPAVEVDLHIHQLVKSERGMDAYEMLQVQIDHARHKIEWAKRERIPKLVFIHGIGAGVLRTELEYLFARYPEITFYDADFQKYGKGATEVYIYQNPKKVVLQ